MIIIGRGIYLQLAILPLLEVDLWILGNLEQDTEKWDWFRRSCIQLGNNGDLN